jgi:hypothetical protein
MRLHHNALVVVALSACARPAVESDVDRPEVPDVFRCGIPNQPVVDDGSYTLRGCLETSVDAPIEGLSLGVLWRNGCRSDCNFSRIDNVPPEVVAEEDARMVLEPLEVTGDFPRDFTLHFNASPPLDILETTANYVTGAVVVTSREQPVRVQRDDSFRVVEDAFPVLFSEEAELLGVTSMIPIYIGYVIDGTAGDRNVTRPVGGFGEAIGVGYHAARYDGETVYNYIHYFICLAQLPPNADEATCGELRYPPDTMVELESTDVFTFDVGGNEDLMHVLGDVNPEELLVE